MSVKKRITWIDIAKCFAIISIVIGHTLKAGVVHSIVYSYHVPLFFFLAGLTFKPKCSFGKIKNDFKRIMIPYYIFGAVSILIYCLMGEVAGERLGESASASVWHCLFGLVYGGIELQFNRPLWFLPCLFATKLLAYLLHHILKDRKAVIIPVIILFCVLSFWYTNNGYFPLPFSMELSFKLFLFFHAGTLLAPYLADLKTGKRMKWIYLAAGVVLFILTVILGAVLPCVNYTNNLFPRPLMFYVAAALGCVSLVFISVAVNKSRPLEYIGRKTLTILLMHKFPIVFFQIIYPFGTWLAVPDSCAGVITAIGVTVITVILCLCADKIIERIVPFVLGYQKKNI